MSTNTSVQFGGVTLRNRLVAASSPLTESPIRLECCRDAGFGMAILKSACPYTRSETGHSRQVVYTNDGYYADSSFEREIMTLDEGVQLYRNSCRLEGDMLLVPSVTVNSLDPDEWLQACAVFAREGAKLIQLDFFYLGTLTQQPGFQQELRKLARHLVWNMNCTVMPKLNPNFNPTEICQLLAECGVTHVSLLDSKRETPPDGSGLRSGTTSYFGSRQLPMTREFLAEAVKCGLKVCAGGGVCSAADAELLLSEGAQLVQVASLVLQKGFTAIDGLLPEVVAVRTVTHSPWCDVENGAECEQCGGCSR